MGVGPAPVAVAASHAGVGRAHAMETNADVRTHRGRCGVGGHFATAHPTCPTAGRPGLQPLSLLPGPMGRLDLRGMSVGLAGRWVPPAPDSGFQGSRGSWNLGLGGRARLAWQLNTFPRFLISTQLDGGLDFRFIWICLCVSASCSDEALRIWGCLVGSEQVGKC